MTLTVSTADNRLDRQLQFIIEIDKMKQIFRRTLLTDGSRQENDAEHSWHLAAMAMLLEEYAAQPVQTDRVLQMVIVHDLVEIYAGDTFAFDVAGNIGKDAREKVAADRLFSQLPDDQGNHIRALWEEFDAMNTPDSRFAASLDRLQPFLHNTLTGGHTWKMAGASVSQVRQRMEPVREGMPRLWAWVEQNIAAAVREGLIQPD